MQSIRLMRFPALPTRSILGLATCAALAGIVGCDRRSELPTPEVSSNSSAPAARTSPPTAAAPSSPSAPASPTTPASPSTPPLADSTGGAASRSDPTTAADAPTSRSAAGSEMAQADRAPAKAGSGPAAQADTRFMTQAAAGGLYEVRAGELANRKASSSDVQAFGSMLVREHSAANDELAAYAKSRNVTLPKTVPPEKQKVLDELGKLSGADFDRQFIQTVGLKDHQEDIALFEASSKSASDPALKAWIDKTLPHLRAHLSTAQRLSSTAKTGMNSSK